MHRLLRLRKLRCVWTYERLGFQKRGHGLIITFLPIKDGSQFVPTATSRGPGVLAGVGKKRTECLFGFRQPTSQPIEAGSNQPCEWAANIKVEGAFDKFASFVQLKQTFVELREFDKSIGRHVPLLDGTLEETRGHLILVEIAAMCARHYQGFRSVRGGTGGFFVI